MSQYYCHIHKMILFKTVFVYKTSDRDNFDDEPDLVEEIQTFKCKMCAYFESKIMEMAVKNPPENPLRMLPEFDSKSNIGWGYYGRIGILRSV